jgi:hypothetical protein
MRRVSPAVRPAPSVLAASTLVAGHALTYLIVDPLGASRQALLARTGHGYWNTAVMAAAIVGAYAAGRAVLTGARHDRTRGRQRFTMTASRFALLGCTAFAALEVAERLAAAAPLGDLLSRGILPLGLVMQAALALVAAALVRLLMRAGEAAARAQHAAPPHSSPHNHLLTPRLVVVFAIPSGAWGVRGPPRG